MFSLLEEIEKVHKDWQSWRQKSFDFIPTPENPITAENELSYLKAHLGEEIKPKLDEEIAETEKVTKMFELADADYEKRGKRSFKIALILCILGALAGVYIVGGAIFLEKGLEGVPHKVLAFAIFLICMLTALVFNANYEALSTLRKQAYKEMDERVALAGVYAMYADYIVERTRTLHTAIKAKSTAVRFTTTDFLNEINFIKT